MRVREILPSRALRTFESISQAQSPGFLYDICEQIQQRYKFLIRPQTIEALSLENGITFSRGSFNNILVEQMQLFDFGIACETSISTDVIDELLDDFEGWATQNYPTVGQPEKFRGYFSRLEVLSEIDLGEAFARYDPISSFISSRLSEYRQLPRNFRVASLKWMADLDPKLNIALPEFSFERRIGYASSASVYFSTAPLRTSDHISLLNQLEKLLNKF